MAKIILSGALGKMGKAITEKVIKDSELEIIAGVDIKEEYCQYKIYTDVFEIKEKADIIIDFSHPFSLKMLVDYAIKHKIPLVVGTTGFTDGHREMLKEAANYIPVFASYNMYIGVSYFLASVKQVLKLYPDSDVSIVDRHHNEKVDAPSGTALMIADAIKEIRPDAKFIYSRTEERKPEKNEVEIYSIRAGNLVGEHRVLFAGEDESLELHHQVTSRNVLATGAIKAALFTLKQKPGYYTLTDYTKSLEDSTN